jgi:MFS family permease
MLALGSLAFSMLQSLVAPALTTIGRDLHSSTSAASWILTAYLLAASVFTPVLGRLADVIGKRTVLIVVLCLLLAGTIMAALAPTLPALIFARAMQGAAGAVLPVSISIVRDVVPQERVSSTVGLLSAIFGVGGGIGILVAGPIIHVLDWHWLFWLPAMLIAVALAGCVLGIPESGDRRGGRIDYRGSALLGISLVAVLLAVSQGRSWRWTSVPTLGLLGLGVIALAVFVLEELRNTEPLIDIRSMRNRGAWTAHAEALIVGFGMFALFLLVPTLLQIPKTSGYGFGATATASGLTLVPAVVTMVVFSALAGSLIRRVGTRPLMLAGSITSTAAFTVAALAHGQLWQVVLTVALAGAGIGLILSSAANAIVAEVPASRTAEALSTNTIARTVGSSIGTALIAAALASQADARGLPSDAGFTTGFWIAAVVSLLALPAALLVPSRAGRQH